ncbi:STAS domain-containing protein [Streptomyces sp. NPDC016309]|uniref:STAS domain-containing protein n=1 Tax=Streptomyces sp. NPDC016309 TaxID=3364965 RepID=UPI0036F8D7A2
MTHTPEAAQPGRLSIDAGDIDGVRVVAVHGEIDHTVRDTLTHELIRFEPAARPRTVIDLSDVSFMDSSGINVLIAAHRAATKAEGWLRLVGPQGPVLRVMELVGINTVIPCYPSTRHALDA